MDEIMKEIRAALDEAADREGDGKAMEGALIVEQSDSTLALLLDNGTSYVIDVKPARIVVQD